MGNWARGWRRHVLVLGGYGFLVLLPLGVAQRAWRAAPALPSIDEHLDPAGGLRAEIDVIEQLRRCELATVEIRSTVSTEREHVDWRGRARATVTAPVRYVYGVDLSHAEPSWITTQAVGGRAVLRVPPPQRLAVEVHLAHAREHVEVSGLRLRSRAGEYFLGLARVDAGPAAEEQRLPPETRAQVEADSLARVQELVDRLAGADRICVVFNQG